MQKIYYGAPGTGKSFEIDTFLKGRGISEEYIFRITFHPDFSYSDFIGQLLPTVIKSGPSKGDVTYDFSKGVFTQALEKSYEDTSKDVYLILEEMSRGNCATIFGDIFQLLDREKKGLNKGYSKYFVNNDLIAKDIIALNDDRVKLPPNLNIIGTVNTSDQNVYVMDTAFKRRFEWEYISTKPVKNSTGTEYENNVGIKLNNGIAARTIKWVDLYGVLNIFISSDKWLGLGEDKQIGQFFIEFDMTATEDEHKKQVKNKLLHYLWFDVCQSSYKAGVNLFDSSVSNFSSLYNAFEDGKKIFSDTFFDCIDKWEQNCL